MKNKRGIAHILVLLFLLAIPLIIIAVLALTGKINIPGLSKQPNVKLKSEYKNPFDKETQYVNPFSEYKNPFDNI